MPTERRAASLQAPTVSIARSEILLELCRQAVLLGPAILEQPAPSVVLKHVGTRSTTIGVNYFVASTHGLTPAKSQLLREIRRLFRHAGVQDGQQASPADLLASLILFESLSRDEIDELAQGLIFHKVDPGAAIFSQNSVGASIYVIRAGIFEISEVGPDLPKGSWGISARVNISARSA